MEKKLFVKVVFSIEKVVQIVLSPVLVVVQYCKYRYCYCIVKYSIKKNSLRPPRKESGKKKFFLQPEVPFLGMDENVPLVLTGVRVTNFLNITNFDLIFLHNTHILSVFVGLFVILFCLSCLSVCLSVCMSVLCTLL